MHVKDILLFSDEWEEVLGRLFPGAQTINFAKEGKGRAVRMEDLEEVDYIFLDIDPLGHVNVWNLAHTGVVTNQRCRWIPGCWKEGSLDVSHSSYCGGVSDLLVHVPIYS